ncbi:MSC_0622 family F1-like ATPase gamma subunit [Mycoplasmopsis hyopharyngis]|uniref:MSC_0622 family F1-like ATPase gamma subunit n=1 Tax=Mycoplasmopsis hyopharyngis TaxID=29558 RepID=UPI003872DBB6
MDLKKVETKLENLKKIESKVNSDKNILLIEIMKQNKKLNFFIENALRNQNLIFSLKSKYDVKNALILRETSIFRKWKRLSKIFWKPKELWIYLTEEQKYATDSYSRYERNILEKIKKTNADFIVIGERAKQFCQNNNLNILKEVTPEEKNNKLSWKLSELIKILYIEDNYQAVHFVINSNKNNSGNFTVLPISDFDIHRLAGKEKVVEKLPIEKYKIFPDIEKFIENQINIFLQNSIESLLVESSFYTAKVGLVSTNKIINELDEEINKLNKKALRIRREIEIEEIVLLTKNNEEVLKRGGN